MDVTSLTLVLGVLVIALLVWAVLTYNAIVRLRNLVQESWRQIDVELQRRHQLVPALVDVVRGYATHEREVLQDVTAARRAAGTPATGPAGRAQEEDALTTALDRLLAVAEAYPQLRAAEPFVQLHNELTTTEDRIAAGRRFYNANVRRLNTRVESFPANLVAAAFAFRRAEYFETSEPSARSTPPVDATGRRDHPADAQPDAPSFGGQRGGFDPRRDAGRATEGAR